MGPCLSTSVVSIQTAEKVCTALGQKQMCQKHIYVCVRTLFGGPGQDSTGGDQSKTKTPEWKMRIFAPSRSKAYLRLSTFQLGKEVWSSRKTLKMDAKLPLTIGSLVWSPSSVQGGVTQGVRGDFLGPFRL